MPITIGFESLDTTWEQTMVNSDVKWWWGRQRQEPGNGSLNSKLWWLEAREFKRSSLNRLVQQWLHNNMKQEVTIEDFSPGSCYPQWKDGKCIKTILRHPQKRTNIYCTRCFIWLFISFILFSPYNEDWELLFPFYRWENWNSERTSDLLQASQLLSTVNRIWTQGSWTANPGVCSLHHDEASKAIQNPASVLSTTTTTTKETLTQDQKTRRRFSG